MRSYQREAEQLGEQLIGEDAQQQDQQPQPQPPLPIASAAATPSEPSPAGTSQPAQPQSQVALVPAATTPSVPAPAAIASSEPAPAPIAPCETSQAIVPVGGADERVDTDDSRMNARAWSDKYAPGIYIVIGPHSWRCIACERTAHRRLQFGRAIARTSRRLSVYMVFLRRIRLSYSLSACARQIFQNPVAFLRGHPFVSKPDPSD